MKASELMVGDWVRVKAPYFKKNKAYRVVEVREHGYNGEATANIELPDEDEEASMTGEYIIGIPITPEILEKNFREYLPGINLMYQLKGPYFAMNEEGDQWVFGLVKEDGGKSCRYPLVKITYVHELQHAIRLCGIDKEIVL